MTGKRDAFNLVYTFGYMNSRFIFTAAVPYIVLTIYAGLCAFTVIMPQSSWLLEVTKGCLLLWLWLQWLELYPESWVQLVIWTFLRTILYASMLTSDDARARLLIVMVPLELLNLLVISPKFKDKPYRWAIGFTSLMLLVAFGIALMALKAA